jgi:hypothetical protein
MWNFNGKKDGGNAMSELALVERMESVATLLERTLGWLEERQLTLRGEVEKISATVEASRREEELAASLEAAQRELAELRAVGAVQTAREGLRRTQPSGTGEMLAKFGQPDGTVDVRALDAALVGLSLEQRIAVKSQLRKAGSRE